ncbi:hypothetical protein F4604DRAFT_1673421 [Suillus subluteus]|nr:hypothetical protein F4604DRAFT_1673421 [Suillus subluteus]
MCSSPGPVGRTTIQQPSRLISDHLMEIFNANPKGHLVRDKVIRICFDMISTNVSVTLPTSSATYIYSPSPGQKTPPYHTRNKGKYNFPSSAPEDEPMIYGPSLNLSSTRVSSDANFLAQAQAILNDSDVPMNDITEAIVAQFTTCEKYCTHLMLKMWEIEEINQWKRFSKCTIATLEKEHKAATSGLSTAKTRKCLVPYTWTLTAWKDLVPLEEGY